MITIGKSTFKRAYFNNKKPTIYLGTQLINPVVWDPSLTDKTSEVHIVGDVVLNGKTDCYSLTFETGGHLTINAGARLRVWKGGITNDDCSTVDYLTLKFDAVNNTYCQFLLHPDVTFNTHPMATVEFISKSTTTSSTVYTTQRFGIPTFGALTSVTAKQGTTDIATGFQFFNYEANAWQAVGYINVAGKSMDYAKMANPFDYYQMQHNTTTPGTVVTMKGQLVGNDSPELSVRGNFWNGYANSYTAAIKTSLLLSLLAEHNITFIQVGDNNTEINSSNVDQWPYIQPLYCQFLIKNLGAQFNLTLSYKDLVWDPSFEEEVTPTRSLSKGNLMSSKSTEIDTTLDGSGIFNDPVPVFLPEHDENTK